MWQRELQNDAACKMRMDNDVAAVAAGVSVYDSYGPGSGWKLEGGTSASTPIVAGVDAISSAFSISLGAEAFYRDRSGLFDVTEGSNGTCTPPVEDEYWCTAEVGYDGPTGNGTPDGPLELEGTPAIAPRPSAWTGFATGVNKGEAALHGTVNPQGSETTYHFEYGMSTSYGSDVPVSGASAGSGLSDVEESETIAGLQPDTVYHYRLVASNSGGTTYGVDRTFQTSTWSLSSTRDPGGVKRSGLSGVSCSSAGACMAVGEEEDGEGAHVTLAESSSGGGEWRALEMPGVAGARESHLSGVSCVSASACVAVGGYLDGEGKLLALAESWSGTEWSITKAPPSPKGARSSVLRGVSCSSVTACVAVGEYENGEGVEFTLVESWNGKAWTIESSWNGADSSFRGVSCSSASACTAVGSFKTGEQELTLVERFNGTAWTFQFSANRSSRDFLSGVSCVSASVCTADGWYLNGEGVAVMLAERWNGTEWQVQSTPGPEGAKSSALGGISCASATACTAVGWYENGSNTLTALVESWDGSEWQIQSAPNPAGASSSELQGVSCSSASCVAAGGYENGEGVPIALAEGGNGGEWQVQSTLKPAEAKKNILDGVSCASASACMAVGEYENSSNGLVTLAESWNGGEWLTVPTPDPAGAKESHLYGVSCHSAEACIAVGGYVQGEGGLEKSLAERWNGAEWAETQSPPAHAGARLSVLRAVSCSSATACIAVGEYENEQGVHLALSEKLSGKEWTVQSTPEPAEASEDALRGVSCYSAKACLAVGFYKNASGRDLTLAESWNGKAWTVVESTPNPIGAQNSFLTGVSCTSAEVCTASGSYVNDEGTKTAIVESWNANTTGVFTAPEWYIQSLAPSEAKSSLLTGVSCTSSTQCTAVGWYEDSSNGPSRSSTPERHGVLGNPADAESRRSRLPANWRECPAPPRHPVSRPGAMRAAPKSHSPSRTRSRDVGGIASTKCDWRLRVPQCWRSRRDQIEPLKGGTVCSSALAAVDSARRTDPRPLAIAPVRRMRTRHAPRHRCPPHGLRVNPTYTKEQ